MTSIVWKTQAAYARHRGCSAVAVKKAIGSGRIPSSAVKREGASVLIDVAAADLAWANKIRIDTPLDDAAAPPAETAPTASSPSVPRETPALTAARTEQAQIETRIKSLELDRRLGKLLEADDVAAAMARCAEALIRDIDQIAARADDVVTAYTRDGAAGVRALLKKLAREIRSTIAENMRLLEAVEADEAAAAPELEADGRAAAPELISEAAL